MAPNWLQAFESRLNTKKSHLLAELGGKGEKQFDMENFIFSKSLLLQDSLKVDPRIPLLLSKLVLDQGTSLT